MDKTDMELVWKLIFVALVAGTFSACLAGVIVTAFGWPLFLVALFAGAGAGAATLQAHKQVKAAIKMKQ